MIFAPNSTDFILTPVKINLTQNFGQATFSEKFQYPPTLAYNGTKIQISQDLLVSFSIHHRKPLQNNFD